MKSLSPGADLAWRIAAHEAVVSGYKFIEKEHLLIGIVSLEKVISDGPDQTGFDQISLKSAHFWLCSLWLTAFFLVQGFRHSPG